MSAEELREGYKLLNFNNVDELVADIFKRVDKDKSGFIDYHGLNFYFLLFIFNKLNREVRRK